MDRNELILVGRVGGNMKKGKAVNGSTYYWLPVEIENGQGSTSTDYNYHQGINCMVFNSKRKNLIEYLERVKVHSGNRVIIFGFVSSFKQTVNGKDIISNAVNVTDIFVVKEAADKTETEKETKNNKQ
jgi:hypothetical protein